MEKIGEKLKQIMMPNNHKYFFYEIVNLSF